MKNSSNSRFYRTTGIILIFVALILGLSNPNNFFNWIVSIFIIVALTFFGIEAWTTNRRKQFILIISVTVLTLITTISCYLIGPYSLIYRYSKNLLLLIATVYLIYIFYQILKRDFQTDKTRFQEIKNRKRR